MWISKGSLRTSAAGFKAGFKTIALNIMVDPGLYTALSV